MGALRRPFSSPNTPGVFARSGSIVAVNCFVGLNGKDCACTDSFLNADRDVCATAAAGVVNGTATDAADDAADDTVKIGPRAACSGNGLLRGGAPPSIALQSKTKATKLGYGP